MKIPQSGRKKALFIIDVQPAFTTKQNKNAIKNIEKLLEAARYDLYVSAIFYPPKNSIWDKQTNWNFPKDKNFKLSIKLPSGIANYKIEKTTKSIFKARKSLVKKLKDTKIKEVHVVGYDTNDCVLATTYESFDYGFFTYIIEECTGSSIGKRFHKEALDIMREVNLTNNSCVEKIKFQKI